VSILTGGDFAIDVVQTGTPGLYRLVGSDAVTLIHRPGGGSMPATYTLLLDDGIATFTAAAYAIAVSQTATPGVYTFVGSDAALAWRGETEMAVAMSASETVRTYRVDVTAPDDTEAVTLFVDAVRHGRVDKFPPWVFTCELATREAPYMLEARIEGPFGTLTASMQLPEDAPPTPPLTRVLHLAWDANPDPKVVGYRIKGGASTQTYTITEDAGHRLDGAINVPTAWPTVYVCIAAYDAANREQPSAELEHTWTRE
jgi:hypothetical protein